MRIITIRGERNSGTNWLRQLLLKNFDIFWKIKKGVDADGIYGWKHGFLSPSHIESINLNDSILIILHRNIFYWLVSTYEKPYAKCYTKCKSLSEFLRKQYQHIDPISKKEETAANIIQLRTLKLKQWLDSDIHHKYLLNYDNVNADFFNNLSLDEKIPLKEGHYRPIDHYTIHGKVQKHKFVKKTEDMIKSKFTDEDIKFIFSQMDESFEREKLGYDYQKFQK